MRVQSSDRPETRLATRLAFFVPGLGIACWASLVPFAKSRLSVEDGILGVLLLCLGLGSVVAMVIAGALSAKYGPKPIIVVSGIALALIMPGTWGTVRAR